MRAVETQRPLRRLLLDDARVTAHLTAGEVDELLDPGRSTGLAAELVDRVTAP
jgi:adenylosuccinate lyase